MRLLITVWDLWRYSEETWRQPGASSKRAIEVNPDEVKSLLDLGILYQYQQMGNRQKALHYLQLFISKVPRGQFTVQLPAVREAIQELRDTRRTAER